MSDLDDKWANLMDENPVLGFLIRENLVNLNLNEDDGPVGWKLTRQGWQMAFEILMISTLQTLDPSFVPPHPAELPSIARKEALAILADMFRPVSDLSPEEVAEMKKLAQEEFGMGTEDE